MNYVGRLAPSPTGAQHVGNARTFLVAWLAARQVFGQLFLRIEDLDTPRTKPGATEQAIEDLNWLGLDWDPTGSEQTFTIQSSREARYAMAIEQLKQRNLIYPCTCTRSEIERAASAPHESVIDGAIYPGTCSHHDGNHGDDLKRQGIPFAWRFRMPKGILSFEDERLGIQSLDAGRLLGDFVVARSYGVTAYQLAVVVDDHDFGINHVVRGNDLVFSTYRQMALYQAFGWDVPAWLHMPLVVGRDGRRLAKRHGDTRLSYYREQGVAPETIIGFLAKSLCLIDKTERISTMELLGIGRATPDWIHRTPAEPLVFVGFGTSGTL